MKDQHERRHMIDLAFPIALLFIFAVSAVTVLILAANLYSKTHDAFETSDEKYGALYYISEKIRQNDANGAIYLETIDGTTCLAMDTTYGEQIYTTYIYVNNGHLQELFAQKGSSISLNSGQSIMTVTGLSIESMEDDLILLRATDSDGHTTTMIAAERSMP